MTEQIWQLLPRYIEFPGRGDSAVQRRPPAGSRRLQATMPLDRYLELFSHDIGRRRKVTVFQPLHADILSPLAFWKLIQIWHEDLQAGFRSHASVAVY